MLATDSAERYGLPLRFAPADVQAELKKHMPEFGSAKNPVDLTGMAGEEWYEESVRFAIAHPWVDGMAVLYCETAMTDPMAIAKAIKAAVEASGVTDKPVTVSFIGGEKSDAAMKWLLEHGIPAYDAPDVAINALAALREYDKSRAAASVPFEYFADVDEAGVRARHCTGQGTGTHQHDRSGFQSDLPRLWAAGRCDRIGHERRSGGSVGRGNRLSGSDEDHFPGYPP